MEELIGAQRPAAGREVYLRPGTLLQRPAQSLGATVRSKRGDCQPVAGSQHAPAGRPPQVQRRRRLLPVDHHDPHARPQPGGGCLGPRLYRRDPHVPRPGVIIPPKARLAGGQERWQEGQAVCEGQEDEEQRRGAGRPEQPDGGRERAGRALPRRGDRGWRGRRRGGCRR